MVPRFVVRFRGHAEAFLRKRAFAPLRESPVLQARLRHVERRALADPCLSAGASVEAVGAAAVDLLAAVVVGSVQVPHRRLPGSFVGRRQAPQSFARMTRERAAPRAAASAAAAAAATAAAAAHDAAHDAVPAEHSATSFAAQRTVGDGMPGSLGGNGRPCCPLCGLQGRRHPP